MRTVDKVEIKVGVLKMMKRKVGTKRIIKMEII